LTGGGPEIPTPRGRNGRVLSRERPEFVSFPKGTRFQLLSRPVQTRTNRCPMASYLKLTDSEWQSIQPVLPVPKRGPKRPHDRATCAAFLFCRAADVSIESLPIGQYPDWRFLRTTEARWRRDGTLERLFEVGAAAQARMARQYENHITELSMRPYRPDRPNKIGHKSKTMPRWSWVRGA
jgi:transposase